MNCQQFQLNCSNILEGESDAGREYALLQHLKLCPACNQHLQHHMQLRRMLRQLPPAPQPNPDLAQRIRNQRRQHKSMLTGWWSSNTASGVMLAASLVLFAASSSFLWLTDQQAVNTAIITATLDRQRQLNLVLHSAAELDHVSFSIVTPQDLPIQGSNSKHHLQWTGQLKKGKNLMSLPIAATGSGSGKLIMEIKYGNDIKQFIVQINNEGKHNA